MKTNKFLLLFLVFLSFSGFAQNKTTDLKPLIINVLIDENMNIYIEENLTPKEDIVQSIKKIINLTPANKHEGVTYRIFADGSLQHGSIMDVNQLLFDAYQPIKTSVDKYLLDTKKNNLDSSDWVEKLNKLDLKAIKIN